MRSGYSTAVKVEAQAELGKVPREQVMTLLRKLTEPEVGPYAFGTTVPVGAPGHHRLRVGDYRVIHTVDEGRLVIVVVEVGHRSSVYD